MLVVNCINKLRDKRGKIIGYTIQDRTGKTMSVKSDDLKRAIQEKKVEVTNLTLTSDNRLLDKAHKNQVIISICNMLINLGEPYMSSEWFSALENCDTIYLGEKLFNLDIDGEEVRVDIPLNYSKNLFPNYNCLIIQVHDNKLTIHQYMCICHESGEIWRDTISRTKRVIYECTINSSTSLGKLLNSLIPKIKATVAIYEKVVYADIELKKAIEFELKDLGTDGFANQYNNDSKSFAHIKKLRNWLINTNLIGLLEFNRFLLQDCSNYNYSVLNYIRCKD